MRVCVYAVIGALAAACGGSTSEGNNGGGSATKSDIDDLCKAQCERDTRCGEVEADCQANFVAGVDHPETFRHDFMASYTKCLTTLACAENDDSCVETAAKEINPNWENDALYKKCDAKYTECDSSFSDDVCGGAIYFSDSAKKTLDSCLNLACDAIGQCIEQLG